MKNESRVARYCISLELVVGSVLLLRMAFLVPRAMAAGPSSFTVNSPSDVADANPGDGKCETAPGNGVCTLRAAIMEANHTTGGATIYFGLPGSVMYKLMPPSGMDDETTGDLNINNTMTIVGNSAANTIIDGNATDRVFLESQCINNEYDSQAMKCVIGPTVVSISGVTIQNGNTSGLNAFGGGILNNGSLTLTNCVVANNSANATNGAAYGGGIYSSGSLTLNNCTINGNKATTQSGFASGGGIIGGFSLTMMNCTVSGNVARDSGGGLYGGGTIINSTFSGNTAGNGGGIYGGSGTIINSTFSDNNANVNGGGIYHSGGTTGLYNVTIAGNTANADDSGSGFGGGIANASGTVNFQNSIITSNINVEVINGFPVANPEDCSGTLTSNGYNIVSETTDCTISGSFSQGDPNLGTLQNNGGPTQTLALLSGSAAVDGGNPGGCTDNLGAPLSTDQRGYTRPPPASGRCDIGAFEAGGSLSHSLGNISTRGFVQIGNNVLIGGVIVTGNGPKKVVLRALGPTLGQPPFNVPGALANPKLDLYNSSGSVIASNDNWGSAANAAAIQSSGYAPPNPLESAILTNLDPGNYTAIVRGVNNTTGVALFEGYDLDSTAASEFGNISTRGFVQTGARVMIAGVIVKGPDSQDVILRALGPTLGQPPFTLPGSLPDPVLDLRDANGTSIMTNDNWKDTQQAEIQATGYAPPNASESAILTTLAPGNYTAILSGKNNTTGNALVEVYGLN